MCIRDRYFYRQPKAPDLEIAAAELDLDAIREARVFWVTVTGLSQEPSRSATLAALEGFGVDARHVSTHPTLRTPIVFCEIFPPDDFPLLFYRAPKAPDMELDAGDLDLDAIRAARIFWVTGTGLADEPSRSATLAALAARGKSGTTILDLDYRPMFWDCLLYTSPSPRDS